MPTTGHPRVLIVSGRRASAAGAGAETEMPNQFSIAYMSNSYCFRETLPSELFERDLTNII